MNSRKIASLAGKLHLAVTIALFVLPALVFAALVRDAMNPEGIIARFPLIETPPGRGTVVAAGLVGFLPLAAILYALVQMRALFALYREGEILTAASAGRIAEVGYGLFALAALGPVVHTIQTLILTWANPPGRRALQIAVDGDLLGFLLSGALMVLIGRVMAEAAQVAEENRGFV